MTALIGRKALSHERILDVASRDVRRLGFHGVNVTEVMRAAGLTHGGFYAHFASRDALLSEAVGKAGVDILVRLREQMAQRRAAGASPFAALVDAYLATDNVQDHEQGCPVTLLGSEIFRQQPEVADPSRRLINNLHRLVKEAMPAGTEGAWAVTSALVGAVQLARALGEGRAAKALLAETRSNLLAQYDT